MLIWERADRFEGDDCMFARIMVTAVDGTPVELLRIAATPECYDIQDRNIGPHDHSGHVLARDSAGSLVANQVHAEAALREILARLLAV